MTYFESLLYQDVSYDVDGAARVYPSRELWSNPACQGYMWEISEDVYTIVGDISDKIQDQIINTIQ